MSASAARDHVKGFERDFVYRTIDFYNDELYLLDQGRLKKIEDVPNSVKKAWCAVISPSARAKTGR